jgi:hypothetical protein
LIELEARAGEITLVLLLYIALLLTAVLLILRGCGIDPLALRLHPLQGQLLGLSTVTVPVLLYFAVFEASPSTFQMIAFGCVAAVCVFYVASLFVGSGRTAYDQLSHVISTEWTSPR